MPSKDALISIVGPTASGKSALAIELAQRYDGEIICADSRTVYRGMDIGTAKPTVEEQALVPHHLLDVVDPNQPFSAAEFKEQALAAIKDIRSHGKLPFLVGGTGLYIDAVLYDYRFPVGANAEFRKELEALPLSELVKRLKQQDPERAEQIDTKNARRVVRALETVGQPRIAPRALPSGTLVLGLAPDMPVLEQRIDVRNRQMLEGGLIEETQALISRYSPVIEPLNTVPYKQVIAFLHEELTEAELLAEMNLRDRHLAKRQLTWFKRNPDIHWVGSENEATTLIDRCLAGEL